MMFPVESKGGNEVWLTREQWLLSAAELLRPLFLQKGILLPAPFRIACGWPLGRRQARRGRSHSIGQCWAQKASKDGSSEIFISPELDDAITVLAVEVHELVHAADDCQHGHRGPFRKMALAIGLQGPMRATHAGPQLVERLNALTKILGPYPHARLDGTQVPGKQSTRLIKVVCDRSSHGYAFWTTRMWLDEGTPTCVCGSTMSEVTRRV